MKYHEIRPETVRAAIGIYLQHAYPAGIPDRRKITETVDRATTTEEVLAGFEQDEVKRDADPQASMHQYTLRLGSAAYPFMKFALHEHLLEGDYIFTVDTHDDLDIRPNFPDYEAWQALKQVNKELRDRIEKAWRDAHLDTCARLMERMLSLPVNPAGFGHGKRVVVADDQFELAAASAALLRSEGFEVDTAGNGAIALERVHARHTDLVFTDYQMPVLDGLQLIERLRSNPETRRIPVLLASASDLTLEEMGRANAFVAKPYSAETLLQFCGSLTRVRASRPEPDGGSRGRGEAAAPG